MKTNYAFHWVAFFLSSANFETMCSFYQSGMIPELFLDSLFVIILIPNTKLGSANCKR